MPKSNSSPVVTDPTLDKRVAQFLQIRGKIDELKEKISECNKCQQMLIGEMLQFLDKNKLKSVRTTDGVLVTAIVKPSAKLEDPDVFMNFVLKNGAYWLLDRRANANACRDHAEENDGVLPPGVKLSQLRTVGVTQS